MKTTHTSGHAPVNGINMYYEIHGEGDIPLLMIHGGGSTIQTSFGKLLPLLAANNKVIAIEMQAHGRTSDRDEQESFAQDADDAAGLLKYLGIAKANVLGYSNGGSTVLQMGIRHPEMVNRIVCIAGAVKRHGFFSGFFDGFEGAYLEMMPELLRKAFLEITPDPAKLQTMFEKDVHRMKNFADWPDEDVKSIKAPVLFLGGDRDVVTPAHHIEMAGLVEGSRLIILPGVHGEYIGEIGIGKEDSILPRVTADLIDDFLRG